MAEEIRTREQARQQATPAVRDTTSNPKTVDFAPAAQALKGQLDIYAKAQKRAEDIYTKDIVTRAKKMFFDAQGKIANAKKLDARRVSLEVNTQLDKDIDKLIQSSQPGIRARLKAEIGESRLPLEKFATLHVHKEDSEHENAVNEASLQVAVQGAMFSLGDDEQFDAMLDGEVKDAAMDIAIADGFTDAVSQRRIVNKAQGEAVLGALESAVNAGEYEEAKNLFARHSDKFLTDKKQQLKAEKLIKQAKEKDIFVQASNLAFQVRADVGADNLEDQLSAIVEAEGFTSEQKEKATQIARTNYRDYQAEKKIAKERQTERKIRFIMDQKAQGKRVNVPELLSDISDPEVRNKVERYVIEGKARSNPETIKEYYDLAQNDQEFFAETFNPGTAVLDLPPEVVKNLTARQNELRDKEKKFSTSTADRHKTFINTLAGARGYSSKSGTKASFDRYFSFKQQAETLYLQMRDSDKYKGIIDTFEFDQEYKRRLRTIKLPEEDTGFFFDKIEAVGSITMSERAQRQIEAGEKVELIPFDDMPEHLQVKFVKKWRIAKGLPPNALENPTDEEKRIMANEYAKSKSRLKVKMEKK